MRTKFDEQLHELNNKLIEMGRLCEKAVASAAKALTTGDEELATDVKTNGPVIDHMERDIESRCVNLLLLQQPVAQDLRFISSALKMITDLERIGDQAEDIAEIVIFLKGSRVKSLDTIREMADVTIAMVKSSMAAFSDKDAELARAVIEKDDVVDNYFSEIRRKIVSLIAEDPTDGEAELDLLMVAKYLERIGDHATNVAEWAIYSIDGTHDDTIS